MKAISRLDQQERVVKAKGSSTLISLKDIPQHIKSGTLVAGTMRMDRVERSDQLKFRRTTDE